MTVKEAIKRADLLRPNALGDEQKAAWLDDLDGQLAELFGTQPPTVKFPNDRDLLPPAPYEEVSVLYLCAKIDYYNQDMDLYANDSAVYEAALAEMRAWWRRTHRPNDANEKWGV